MAIGLSNPNGSVGVSTQIDPVGANAFFAPGVVGGFHTTPTSPAGMKVNVGGSFSDSALVQSSTGVIYPLGNTDGSAIEVTIPAAPATNKRIDSIVLYVDPTVTATQSNGTDTCGIEVVSGTSAANPVPPTDAQIKAVIGAGSAYLVIANVTVNSGATTITASNIAEVNRTDQITAAKIASNAVTAAKIASNAVTAAKIDFTTLAFGNYSTSEKDTGFTWIDGKHIYKKTYKKSSGTSAGENRIQTGITNSLVIKSEIFLASSSYVLHDGATGKLTRASADFNSFTHWTMYPNGEVVLYLTTDQLNTSLYITLWYVK